jgi:hypothetical protein
MDHSLNITKCFRLQISFKPKGQTLFGKWYGAYVCAAVTKWVRTLNKIYSTLIRANITYVLPNSVSFASQGWFQLGLIYSVIYIKVNYIKSVWILNKLSWNQCVQNMRVFLSQKRLLCEFTESNNAGDVRTTLALRRIRATIVAVEKQ